MVPSDVRGHVHAVDDRQRACPDSALLPGTRRHGHCITPAPVYRALTRAHLSAMTSTALPTGTSCVPSGTRMAATYPSSCASQPIVALSVSISQMRSPGEICAVGGRVRDWSPSAGRRIRVHAPGVGYYPTERPSVLATGHDPRLFGLLALGASLRLYLAADLDLEGCNIASRHRRRERGHRQDCVRRQR